MDSIPSDQVPPVIISTDKEPVAAGPFKPTWQSLRQYQVPEWFRNAKFGIWAHWGPQCQPEDGDWYARNMYMEGSGQYKHHVQHYGHPSQTGFKDIMHEWKAEKWDPDKLVKLYKRVGAQYFFAMANHHDNLDLWNSRYHAWNSLRVGPEKDIVGGWAAAARKYDLPFGLSVHAAHAWMWYETAQGADKDGPYKGVPYDGRLTRADGKGKWWEGLDPQELYAQNHPLSQTTNTGLTWNWGHGASTPDQAYCENFYNRTMDLINQFHPDLLYFDDTALPLWPVSDAGLKIAAHFYNQNRALHQGKLEGVIFGKILTEDQKQAVVWDVERGVPARIENPAWQTDTCIGGWHYSRSLYDRNGYKNAAAVVHMLADIVSKNGNLLLNVPVRGDGTIDEKEEKILLDIAAWMDVNSDAIFGTRPWKIFGEGPASDGAPISAQGFNEGKGKPFTAEDVRFTVKGDALYIIVMGVPSKPLEIKSLAKGSKLLDQSIATISLLGQSGDVQWNQESEALVIQPPTAPLASNAAAVYKVVLK